MRYMLDHSHAEDLAINSFTRFVRTRLYFTSESHLHTLLNVLRYPRDGQPCAFSAEGLRAIEQAEELGYLTQVVFRLFEDRDDPSRFRCEVLFTTGATNDPFVDKSCNLAPYTILNRSISCEQMIQCLDNAIAERQYATPMNMDFDSVQSSSNDTPSTSSIGVGSVPLGDTPHATDSDVDTQLLPTANTLNNVRFSNRTSFLEEPPAGATADVLRQYKIQKLVRTQSMTVISGTRSTSDQWERVCCIIHLFAYIHPLF